MRKSLLNIKHFVDSSVRQTIDRATNNNCDFIDEDLLLVERQFEDVRQIYIETEKRISSLLQSVQVHPPKSYTQNVQAGLNNLSQLTTQSTSSSKAASLAETSSIATTNSLLSNSDSDPHQSKSSAISACQQAQATFQSSNNCNSKNYPSNKPVNLEEIRDDLERHKKLPIVGFLKFLVKARHKSKKGSLLAATFNHCSQLQTQLTKLYLSHEQTVESQCLKPLQHVLEVDIPNIIKLRKLFIKSHNDLGTQRSKYNGAHQKQQQLQQISQGGHLSSAASYTITQNNAQQANTNKLDQLKKELEEAETKFDQAKDTYAAELYAFVCRECELVSLLKQFYQIQAKYHQQVGQLIESSLPSLGDALDGTRRKVVFGAPLSDHLACTGRQVSPVIELSVHLLHSIGLDEEGLFRIPGSSMKIKKLKNAINAWFVTLASQNELDVEHNSRSSLITILDLFREILGQKPQQHNNNNLLFDGVNNNSTNSGESHFQNSCSLNQHQIQQRLIYDLHSIAGLLKLYLRELPEHLFTYSLYDKWIEVTVKTTTIEERIVAYERLLTQLPRANYDNLRHLIRFLHLLTSHREQNKMTASNLAITMAPSLIWTKPPSMSSELACRSGEQTSDTSSKGLTDSDNAQALNMHISNIGVSTSLHTLVIETFISNAERLLPGQVQLSIPGFEETTTPTYHDNNTALKKPDRTLTSSSPTGLSTASSSSFSSSSNGSVKSTDGNAKSPSGPATFRRQHDRRGGSMEGLLGNEPEIHRTNYTSLTRSRPVSVFVQPTQRRLNQPPPTPPPPVRNLDTAISRVYKRQSSLSSGRKAPAPPPPSSKPTVESGSAMGSNNGELPPRAPSRATKVAADQSTFSKGAPGPSGGSMNSVRPSVPPPERPAKLGSVSTNPMPNSDEYSGTRSTPEDLGDNKSANSITSSGNFRNDFEEISSNDVEEVSVSVSPIASLDSISGEDSSFNGDHEPGTPESLQSWGDLLNRSRKYPPIPNKPEIYQFSKSLIGSTAQQSSLGSSLSTPGASSTTTEVQNSTDSQQSKNEINQQATGEVNKSSESNNDNVTDVQVPKKPPRCQSPRVTQSTPL